MNTHVAVSNICHDVLKIREGMEGQVLSVSMNDGQTINGNAYNLLGPDQVSASTTKRSSGLLPYPAYPESRLLRRRTPALDVTS